MPAQPKVSKRLLPHHSAPRLGSVYPTADLEPWAAAKGHPWPSSANPASMPANPPNQYRITASVV